MGKKTTTKRISRMVFFGFTLLPGIKYAGTLNIYTTHAWVVPLKEEKGIPITNAFQKILDKLGSRVAESKGPKQNIWGN